LKVIIVGAGEVGFHIASHLARENKDVVVIDSKPDAIRRVSENIDVQTIIGNGSNPVLLEEAGIKEAEILLAVTNSDEANLAACLCTDIISGSTRKLARIRGRGFDKYHEKLREHSPHIDTLINPEIEVVKAIQQFMSVPGAVDIGEFADGRVKFVGVTLDKGTRLHKLRLSEVSQNIEGPAPLIAAIIRDEKLIIPGGQDRLRQGDLIYFISEEEKLVDTLSVFDKHAEPIRRVLITGGGWVGFRFASILEKEPISVKIIEKDPARCAVLAEKLNKTAVFHGDGSDQALLAEENVQDMDLVVTLTNDEKTNILASLLATKMGARKTITRISQFSYLPLMSAIGLQQVVSPRLSAINTILQHIRRGKVISAISIKGELAEVIEAVAMETADIVGKPLKEISLPKGSLVISIIHGTDVIIPSGESIIQPGDRIIIFTEKQAIPQIEKILAVKLEFF
jgi:trk system potassium uptake protein TrkA